MLHCGMNYFYCFNTDKLLCTFLHYRIEVLSGYDTSILCFESGLHLEIDLSHKVLRAETALDVIYDIQSRNEGQRQGDIHAAITRALMGSVVMTR